MEQSQSASAPDTFFAVSGYVVPFANVIVPAALWMMWRDSDEFVREQGREALNFQISVLIYFVVSLLLVVLLIGFLLLVAVGVFQIAFMLAATVAASKKDGLSATRLPCALSGERRGGDALRRRHIDL